MKKLVSIIEKMTKILCIQFICSLSHVFYIAVPTANALFKWCAGETSGYLSASLLRTAVFLHVTPAFHYLQSSFLSGKKMSYLTPQQWEREGWEMHQRILLISFREKTRGLILSCNWGTKEKGDCCGIRIGRGERQQLRCGASPEAARSQRCIFCICRWSKTVLILPCRLFVPKQSHLIYVLICTSSPRMTPDLGYLATCLGWHFLLRQSQLKNSWVPCIDFLAHAQRWAWPN